MNESNNNNKTKGTKYTFQYKTPEGNLNVKGNLEKIEISSNPFNREDISVSFKGTLDSMKVNTKEPLKQRMYCITHRSLSEMAKGIQAAHSIVEYSNRFGSYSDYQRWAQEDKTLIVLEVNTENELWDVRQFLEKYQINFAYFTESDLGNIVTSISFLLDERIYDKDKFPIDENGFIIGQDKRYTILRDWIFGLRLASS